VESLAAKIKAKREALKLSRSLESQGGELRLSQGSRRLTDDSAMQPYQERTLRGTRLTVDWDKECGFG
jgi:hypothetical protein